MSDNETLKEKNAKLIEEVHSITDEIVTLAGGAGSSLGTGGMRTKLTAAKLCTAQGVDTVIANGDNPALLYAIVQNKKGGYTRFFA